QVREDTIRHPVAPHLDAGRGLPDTLRGATTVRRVKRIDTADPYRRGLWTSHCP
ncbi:hypothetical protein A2U01_0103785, partial [Trifolium medium]|nr:hypothetical protein [Trifolium medium]